MKYLSYSLCLVAFWLLSTDQIYAQGQIKIRGQVYDSTSAPLVGATVMLMQIEDEVLKGFAIADQDGKFVIQSERGEDLKLRITFLGYGTFDRVVSLENDQKELDLGKIILRPNTLLLDGVTVKESFIPIVIKQDTIEYTADAFKTEPNAVVEDLLKRLPGVEVERDGTIKAQGKEVERVLVEGKEFFDDDPKVASKNLPADIVDKVQVYDDDSDFSKFTGIDDGQDIKTINLKLKEGKNKGLFGKIDASYGTDQHYAGSVNLNRFTKKMQLSTLSNSNNINEMPFTLMDYLDFSGGLRDLMGSGAGNINLEGVPRNLFDNAGLTTATNIGLNFNYDFSKKLTLRSNYFFDLSDNNTLSKSEFRNILPNGILLSQADRNEREDLSNHRFKLKLKHKFDGTKEFTANVKLKSSRNDRLSKSSNLTYNETNILTNGSTIDNNSEFSNLNWNIDLAFRKRLKKKGRSYSIDLGVDKTDNNYLYLINNYIDFFESGELKMTDTTRQRQIASLDGINYALKMNYIEPIGQKRFLSLNASRQTSGNDKDKLFEDKINQNEYRYDESLSNLFRRDYDLNKIGLSIKSIKEKYQVTFGADFQNANLHSRDKSSEAIFNKQFNDILPYMMLIVNVAQNTSLRINYRTNINIPTVEQMQPVVDNSNALNTYIGNPDLTSEFTHTININFNRFNPFYFRSFFSGINFNFRQDQIIVSEIIDDQLRRVRMPVNSGSAWTGRAHYEFSSPIPSSNFKFSYGGTARFSNSNILVNSSLDRLYNTVWEQTLKIENKKKDKLDWILGARLNSNYNRYEVSELYNQNYSNYSWYGTLGFNIKQRLYFHLDFERLQYSKTLFNSKELIDNFDSKISYIFPNKLFTVYVSAQNLFDQQLNFQRNNSANSYYQLSRNQLGRYFMIGVIYKVRKFGK